MKTNLAIIPLDELKTLITQTVNEAIAAAIPPEIDYFDGLPEWLTRKQTADALNVCLTKVDQLAKEGRLKKYRNESIVRFKKSEVQEFYQDFQKWKRS